MLIRDDDISYFTSPRGLDQKWSNWYGKVDIIFSITPFMVESETCLIKDREFSSHQLGEKEFDIAENTELVIYIKDLLFKRCVKIGLHGYNHRYEIKNGTLIAEYDVKNEELLYQKSIIAKKYLENLFKTNIDIFIPPDNAVSANAIKALSRSGFKKVLRAFPLTYIDTKFSYSFVLFWIKRLYFKLKYNLVYSKTFFNGHLYEEASYLYKGQSVDKLVYDYRIHKKHKIPFTLATHYWELEGDMKKNLDLFLKKVLVNEYN
tara:strand:+ start:1583 stop:2368 length:786 start_codon:yes stop_codon:yes gene_type:complete